jgi:hypothetical protein
MSIFVRPDSPPPRQPSPDILPEPLPYPHHPRRIPSRPKIRIHSARSYDFLNIKQESLSDDGHCSLRSTRPRTRSNLNVSPVTTPSSSPAPPSAFSYSPSAPPVPYRYTGPKHIICPKPVSCTPITLPELNPSTNSSLALPAPPGPVTEKKPTLPPLQKPKSMGIACLKFFGIRTSPSQPQSGVTAM